MCKRTSLKEVEGKGEEAKGRPESIALDEKKGGKKNGRNAETFLFGEK